MLSFKMSPEEASNTVKRVLKSNRELVSKLISESSSTWESFIVPFVNAGEKLEHIENYIHHMNAVNNSDDWRKANEENIDDISQYYTEISQNESLYNKYLSITGHLTETQKYIIEKTIRSFVLSGVNLSKNKRDRLKEINEELSTLSSKFSNNVLDSTNANAISLTDDELSSISNLVSLKDNKVPLRGDLYVTIMKYCDNQSVRERLYKAYNTKASEFTAYDNTQVIDNILSLRAEKAKILGLNNYAELSLATKMAPSTQSVIDFLTDLANKAKPFAINDYSALIEYAKNKFNTTLNVWDVAYYSEKMLSDLYSFSSEEVKRHFKEEFVLSGLFNTIEKLYTVKIESAKSDVWNDDVKFFLVKRNNCVIGSFYLDIYARDNKRGGAWMDSPVSRKVENGLIQLPIAYVVCNFSKSESKTLYHDDVNTLFHEFGHAFHHLLSNVEDLDASMSHVEWDAVEQPSQFFENFCFDFTVISKLTNNTFPAELFDKLISAKNFQAALGMIRQIEMSIFDIVIHMENGNANDILNNIRNNISVIKVPEYNRFQNAFSHIFSGGYAAGYYSYKWAEVLSANVFDVFEKNGVINPDIGNRYANTILAIGSSKPAMDAFREFVGAEPDVSILLKGYGLL